MASLHDPSPYANSAESGGREGSGGLRARDRGIVPQYKTDDRDLRVADPEMYAAGARAILKDRDGRKRLTRRKKNIKSSVSTDHAEEGREYLSQCTAGGRGIATVLLGNSPSQVMTTLLARCDQGRNGKFRRLGARSMGDRDPN